MYIYYIYILYIYYGRMLVMILCMASPDVVIANFKALFKLNVYTEVTF